MPQGVIYGDYFLLGRLAQGGMAEVFLAKGTRAELAGSLLALKRTLTQYASEDDFIRMFTDEARIASGLKHSNICEIYDHGQLGEQHYIVMEFIHGKDLKVVAHRARQRNELIPHAYVAYILSCIARALHVAHNKHDDAGELERIVHRDVSPQNILISYDGPPKLIDFGIAKAKDRLSKTQAGVVKGKFAYMSPEQAIGGEVDYRTDIFALGVVLYELLVGELPFSGSSDFSTLKKIAKADYAAPPAESIPKGLIRVIEKTLTRSPEDRYPTAEAFAKDLDQYLLDEDRTVSEQSISVYMRKLFREDYIREMDRIKQYLSIKPPRSMAVEEAEAEAEVEVELEEEEENTARHVEIEDEDDDDIPFEEGEDTRIMSSADLAAGYVDSDEFTDEVTGLAELLEPEVLKGSAPKPVEDATGSHALVPGEFDSGFDEPTTNLNVPNFDFQETTDENPAPETGEAEAVILDDDDASDLEPVEIIDVEEVAPLDFDEPTIEMSSLDFSLADGTLDDAATVLATPDRVKIPERLKGPNTTHPEAPPVDSGKRRRPTGRSKPQRRPTSGSRKQVAPEKAPSGRHRTGQRRGSGRSGQGRALPRRRPSLLTGLEMVTLLIAVFVGIGFVFSTFYVTNNGVPSFAHSLKPTIESFTGELPKHPSELERAPTPITEVTPSSSGSPTPVEPPK